MDFRDKAVEESREILGRDGFDPLTVNTSLCLVADPDGRAAIRRHAFGMIAKWGLAILATPGGAILAYAGWIVAGAAIMVTSAFLVLVVFLPAEKRRLVGTLSSRPGSFVRPDRTGPLFKVEIEDRSTADVLKLHAEDVALVAPVEDSRRLLIEGMSHRYLIRSEDVVSASPRKTAGSSGVVLVYRVGKIDLGLVLSYQSVSEHAEKMIPGRSTSYLWDALRIALGREP